MVAQGFWPPVTVSHSMLFQASSSSQPSLHPRHNVMHCPRLRRQELRSWTQSAMVRRRTVVVPEPFSHHTTFRSILQLVVYPSTLLDRPCCPNYNGDASASSAALDYLSASESLVEIAHHVEIVRTVAHSCPAIVFDRRARCLSLRIPIFLTGMSHPTLHLSGPVKLTL